MLLIDAIPWLSAHLNGVVDLFLEDDARSPCIGDPVIVDGLPDEFTSSTTAAAGAELSCPSELNEVSSDASFDMFLPTSEFSQHYG